MARQESGPTLPAKQAMRLPLGATMFEGSAMKSEAHEARWWETMADGRLHCYLCPRHCHIGEGQHGFCFIRKNDAGRLVQLAYGRPAAVAIDPIEKKPLNHFFPGTANPFHGHRRLQHGLLLLPELGHLQGQSRSGSLSDLSPKQVVVPRARASHASHRVHLQRADHLGRVRHRHRSRSTRPRASTP